MLGLRLKSYALKTVAAVETGTGDALARATANNYNLVKSLVATKTGVSKRQIDALMLPAQFIRGLGLLFNNETGWEGSTVTLRQCEPISEVKELYFEIPRDTLKLSKSRLDPDKLVSCEQTLIILQNLFPQASVQLVVHPSTASVVCGADKDLLMANLRKMSATLPVYVMHSPGWAFMELASGPVPVITPGLLTDRAILAGCIKAYPNTVYIHEAVSAEGRLDKVVTNDSLAAIPEEGFCKVLYGPRVLVDFLAKF